MELKKSQSQATFLKTLRTSSSFHERKQMWVIYRCFQRSSSCCNHSALKSRRKKCNVRKSHTDKWQISSFFANFFGHIWWFFKVSQHPQLWKIIKYAKNLAKNEEKSCSTCLQPISLWYCGYPKLGKSSLALTYLEFYILSKAYITWSGHNNKYQFSYWVFFHSRWNEQKNMHIYFWKIIFQNFFKN